MDKKTALTKAREFAGRVKMVYPRALVVLFGSYARGTAREDSDIDVAVVVGSMRSDRLLAESKLFRMCRDIDARIEPVIVERDHDESGFLEEILKIGVQVSN